MSDPTNDPRPVRTAVSATTTLAVIVAVVAVVLGFLILRDISDSSDTSSPTPDGQTVQTDAPSDDTAVDASTTTVKPRRTTTTLFTTGFEVMVANASGIGGSAGDMTDQLKAKGFVTVDPTNAAAGTPTANTTVVYAVTGFEEGAASVAQVLGGVEVQPMPTPVPVEDGSLGSASVLVMLGTDLAGKDLPKRPRASSDSANTTTTVAG